MKTFIIIAKGLITILLALNLFFWVAAHASGHKIPIKTDWSFGISSIILLAIFLLLNFLGKKKN